ncbi:PilZ domain-containing protein [Anaerobacillus isosaccharinicus]|uniref:PilZ domain-containing protein n=1 Tax=Anaerobacillus isosaccharinicus TaxID=1532552 RepID=A0A1S2LHE5_9BACI|nr:PilZ domain-containing protein [Anaerobacillus isosaccharinicus]MBA5587779.1 PilZ domain-containing protein [Anaerobacillus isosaccharinicus]QOY34063.1 PilZ domain-containing protein [Anaerobacillus isosaccharinicus]
MKYRREEILRYEFTEKVICDFKIINDLPNESNFLEGQVVDLSPSGLKLFSSVDLPTEKKLILYVEFTINVEPIRFSADLIWKKNVGNGFHYGLKQQGTSEDKQLLINELKLYAKTKRNKGK